MKRNRFTTVAVAAGVTLTLLAGCAGGTTDAEPGEPGEEGQLEITLLLPHPLGLSYPAEVNGVAAGFFEEAGANVTTEVADGSGYLGQQIIAGNVEFALMSAADAVVAFNVRDDLSVLLCSHVNNVYRIVTPTDSGITEIADLEGQSLGFTELGGGEVRIVNASLAEAGLVPNENVTLVPVGGAGPTSLTALQNGTVQAYASSYPDIAALRAQGIDWLDITSEKYSAVPGVCLTTTEEVLNTDAGMEKAIALATGWVNSLFDVIEDPAGALNDACEFLPAACENPEAAAALHEESVNLLIPDEGLPGELRLASWETVVELLASSDTVPADMDVRPLISGENVEAVIEAAYAGR